MVHPSLGVCFYFISKLVDLFEGGFATYGSEVVSLEEGVIVVNIHQFILIISYLLLI